MSLSLRQIANSGLMRLAEEMNRIGSLDQESNMHTHCSSFRRHIYDKTTKQNQNNVIDSGIINETWQYTETNNDRAPSVSQKTFQSVCSCRAQCRDLSVARVFCCLHAAVHYCLQWRWMNKHSATRVHHGASQFDVYLVPINTSDSRKHSIDSIVFDFLVGNLRKTKGGMRTWCRLMENLNSNLCTQATQTHLFLLTEMYPQWTR